MTEFKLSNFLSVNLDIVDKSLNRALICLYLSSLCVVDQKKINCSPLISRILKQIVHRTVNEHCFNTDARNISGVSAQYILSSGQALYNQ